MTTLYRAIIVAGFMATASLADIDPQRMQRAIRIMEGILSNQNLYYDVPDGADFRARGLYLEGYGVLFVAAGPAPGTERWDKKLSQAGITGCNPRPARRISGRLCRHHRSTRPRRPDNGLLPASFKRHEKARRDL